jgi:nucleoid DNA-binding protein
MDEIIKKLAKKYDLSPFEVEHIVKSQFRFVKETMEAGDFKSVRLKHLGLFTVKKNRFKYYKDGRREKECEGEDV